VTAMRRAAKQCKTCPFRGLDKAERRELAKVPAEEWPCHSEQGYLAYSDIQCRGHWEARRALEPKP
jgi:hypothetical protein